MNCRIFSRFICIIIVLATISACSSGSGPFDRFTAQAVDSNGNPLDGLSVLVNGQNTGVISDNDGSFQLDESYFSYGVDSVNRVSIGEKGIVLASRELVPSNSSYARFHFPKAKGDTGVLSGSVFDDYNAVPVENAKLILFNEDLGLFQAFSNPNGNFEIRGVPEGNYQVTARKDDFHPGIAMVQIMPNNMTYQGISLQPKNKARYTEGIMVGGYVINADTKEPIPQANISMTVDSGWIGTPEPWMDPDENTPGKPDEDWAAPMPGDPDGFGMPVAPRMYDSQYQEMETDANGYFMFEFPAVGYGIYLNYWKDGFLGGNQYIDIYGMEDDLALSLELTPLVMTSASGQVIDELGIPVKGAYVEFIFAGEEMQYYGNDGPMLGMPSDPSWEGFETAVDETKGFGGDMGAPQAPPGMDEMNSNPFENPLDNPLMQRYRWENQNGRGGQSLTEGGFCGFYSTNADDDGNFTFDELPVGAYYIFVSAYKHTAISTDIEVVEESSANSFEFILENIPVGVVKGIVTDEYGMIVHDALVNCVQPRIDPFDYTNENGEYRIENVPAGDWIVSAFKYGYLTDSSTVYIGEDEEVIVDLQIQSYTPPQVTTVWFSGRVIDGISGDGIEGARMIFTTADNQFFYDATSGHEGYYSAELIATEYNVLIQAPEFQDLYMGFWVDTLYPQYDFSLWSIYGGSGSWGGMIGVPPPMMDDFDMPNAGGTQEGSGGEESSLPFDPDEHFNGRR